MKFPSHLNCNGKIVSEMGPRVIKVQKCGKGFYAMTSSLCDVLPPSNGESYIIISVGYRQNDEWIFTNFSGLVGYLTKNNKEYFV